MERTQTKIKNSKLSLVSASLKYVLVVLELSLFLRFFMKLMGADAAALFTQIVYIGTEVFVFPFKNVLESYFFAGIEIEPAVILAGVVYWIATVVLTKFLDLRKETLRYECPEAKEEKKVKIKIGEGKVEGAA